MEKLTKYDKETTITYDNGNPCAEIFTYDKKLINKLKKNVKFSEVNDDGSVMCSIPKTWLKISTPRKLSEETRMKLKEKGRLMGLKNKSK